MVIQSGSESEIDWENHNSPWFAEPSNHRLFPGASDYHRYQFAAKYVKRGDRLLDIGCNCGQLVVNFAQDLSCDCVGIDIVPEFISNCLETKAEWGRFMCADFGKPPSLDLLNLGTFDVITALEIIEHPLNIRGFRQNVTLFLKPGGYLVITTPHPESEKYGYTYYRTHPHHVRMWTRWRLEQVFGSMVEYREMNRLGELAQIGAVFRC